MIEVLFVLVIIGVIGAIAMPQYSRWAASSRVDNAAQVVAGDLRLATSLALRQGRPVRFELDDETMVLRIVDPSDGTELHRRSLGGGSELSLQSLSAEPAAVSFYPNRTASEGIQITLGAGGNEARVDMTSATFIEVERL